jgi:hypothetical protein
MRGPSRRTTGPCPIRAFFSGCGDLLRLWHIAATDEPKRGQISLENGFEGRKLL